MSGAIEDGVAARAAGLPFREGFPAYVQEARAFVVHRRPQGGRFPAGLLRVRRARAFLNVRALSQVCPHLGCRPNPCIEDFWFRCPCHQSRYDRLGIKVAGTAFGPAERGMDRYGVEVDENGVLTIDRTDAHARARCRSPSASPGVIPPRVANGCA